MLNLSDGTLLYHGSYTEIRKIDLAKCKNGKDFGRGFYVTSSYDQAQSFVRLSVNKQIREGSVSDNYSAGFVSVFRFHLTGDISIHTFPDADTDWLHFVASNRRKSLFSVLRNEFEGFDIIGGKIANDRTARTLQLYTSGGYGEPGSQEADNIAIMTLLPNRLEDQFCFRSESAIRTLEFVRSDLCEIGQK